MIENDCPFEKCHLLVRSTHADAMLWKGVVVHRNCLRKHVILKPETGVFARVEKFLAEQGIKPESFKSNIDLVGEEERRFRIRGVRTLSCTQIVAKAIAMSIGSFCLVLREKRNGDGVRIIAATDFAEEMAKELDCPVNYAAYMLEPVAKAS